MSFFENIEIVAAIIASIATIIAFLFSITLKDYRYRKWYFSILLTVGSFVTISFFLYTLLKDSQEVSISDLNTQINRLNDIEFSLNDLQRFIDEQKKRLHDAEATIKKLEEQKDKLKPLVEADRKTVEAIFAHLEERGKHSVWGERFVGLLFGILASLLATGIYKIVSTKIRSQRPPKREAEKDDLLLFSDSMEEFKDWHDFKKGTLSQSKDVFYEGRFSLKKEGNNDPHGGFKIMKREAKPPFLFSGWIYRPQNWSGGAADRLAIEDSAFNGYGFAVNHKTNQVWIEKRGSGAGKGKIGSVKNCNIPKDCWYQFEFYIRTGGNYELRIYSSSNKEIVRIDDALDTEYSLFDRVVVHGGHIYYMDDLKVKIEQS